MTIDLTNIVLAYGSHSSRKDGMCAMEAAAYVAGEKHSDNPQCVSPVIGAFMRSWNDSLPDDESRTRLLLPLIHKIINTAGSVKKESQRSWMALDWLTRECAPAWLDAAGLGEHAAALRALAPIVGKESAEASNDALIAASCAANEAANEAARAASRAAVWVAAWDAANDAAGDSACDAARAATSDAASDAVSAAARAAAGDAANDAAWAAATRDLAPTVELLQASAVHLVERMAAL